MNYTYRKAQKEDYSKIVDIENKSFKEDRFKDCDILRIMKYCDIIIQDDKIIGYAAWIPNKKNAVRLYNMCILWKYRGNGIAYGYIYQKILDLNKSSYYLEVSQDNIGAINLYFKLGFKIKKKLCLKKIKFDFF